MVYFDIFESGVFPFPSKKIKKIVGFLSVTAVLTASPLPWAASTGKKSRLKDDRKSEKSFSPAS